MGAFNPRTHEVQVIHADDVYFAVLWNLWIDRFYMAHSLHSLDMNALQEVDVLNIQFTFASRFII